MMTTLFDPSQESGDEDIWFNVALNIARRICKHENRAGGNDYVLCLDCGFSWDYRREHWY
jgi:hypothetical protein